MAKIKRTWEKRAPKYQWTTFWMETLNKAFVQVPKYQKIPKKIGTEGGPRGVIIAPGLKVSVSGTHNKQRCSNSTQQMTVIYAKQSSLQQTTHTHTTPRF